MRSPYFICYNEAFMTKNSNYLWYNVFYSIIMEYNNNDDYYQEIKNY